MWRSLLFVPILNERLVAGAAKRRADAIVLDMEAAVPLARKDDARATLADTLTRLRGANSELAVRVNPLGAGGEADIAAATQAGADLIVLPHATPEQTAQAAKRANGTPLIPLIESPRGVINALPIAEIDCVAALGLGVEDYATEMGAPPTPDLLVPAAFQVIQAARAAGRLPLILPDTIADYSDLGRFETAANTARAMGASGGFAIHPDQVDILNRVFTPTPQEQRTAADIIKAAELARQGGQAIATVNGRMVDEPVEARARAILDISRRFQD